MSLFGLLVSLFSIHLGSWLSRLRALRTKWNINSGSDPGEISARRECRYVLTELYNWQPFVMTLIIGAFGLAVLYFFNDVRLTNGVRFPSIFVYLYNGFFLIMLLLQGFLLLSGWRVGNQLQMDVEKAFPTSKRTV